MDIQQHLDGWLSQEKIHLGIHDYAILKSRDVRFSHGTRIFCESNVCGFYHTTWACPPAVGSYESCRQSCLEYEHVCLFTTLSDLAGRNNWRGWMAARDEHEAITRKVDARFTQEIPAHLTLSTEGCSYCETCTYPDSPCPFPEYCYPSVEGYGIIVSPLAERSNIRYSEGADTLKYFSLIFF